MKNTINHQGWFVLTLSGLACGDASIVKRYNNTDLKEIVSICSSMANSGFARYSRKGWRTIEHPILGTVQWKFGYTPQAAKEYFFLRLNGKMLIRAWPSGERFTHAEWVAAPEDMPEWEKKRVERFLGSIQGGSDLSPEMRDAA